jgi:hypothetical protein
MQTLMSIVNIVTQIEYADWTFKVGEMGDGAYLQVAFKDATGQAWTGRKWYVSLHSVESEVVQTALKAVLTALEHEAREAFKYKGFAIFGPHHDVNAMLNIAQQHREPKR